MPDPVPKTTVDSPGWKHLLPYVIPQMRSHRRGIVLGLVALVAETALRLLEPWPLKWVFDRILGYHSKTNGAAGSVSDWAGYLGGLDQGTLLLLAAFSVLAIAGGRALAGYVHTIQFASVGTKVITHLRDQVFRHLQRLSLSFHSNSRTGDLMVRVMGDVSMLQDVLVTALVPLLVRVLILVGMIGTMFWMNWQLALLATALLPLFGWPSIRLSRQLREVAKQQRRREGSMSATAAESIGAMKTVQAMSLQDTFSDQFGTANKKSLKMDVRGKRLAASLERSVDVFIAAATALVLWQGTRMALESRISPGDLLVFLAYLKTAFRPLQDIAKFTGRLGKASAASARVVEILREVPDVTDRSDAVVAPALSGEVRWINVSFSYQGNAAQLNRVSFHVRPGQRVAVVGHSGSGKSTVLNLLLRLCHPQSGLMELDGRDSLGFTAESVRQQISVVMQDAMVFAGSFKENIALGMVDVDFADIEAAAKLAQIHDFIMEQPEGYDAPVGERGVKLSQGQRQRLAIARAALRKTPFLLLDEPCTGLDENNKRLVRQALVKLGRGRTTFWVTHELEEVEEADWVLCLEKGVLVEVGMPRELRARGGVFHKLFSNGSRRSPELFIVKS